MTGRLVTKPKCGPNEKLILLDYGRYKCESMELGGLIGDPCCIETCEYRGAVGSDPTSGDDYCTPCHTIQYFCPDTFVPEVRRICPNEENGDISEQEALAAADKELKNLIGRGCWFKESKFFIRDGRYFIDRMEELLAPRFSEQKRQTLQSLISAFQKSSDQEREKIARRMIHLHTSKGLAWLIDLAVKSVSKTSALAMFERIVRIIGEVPAILAPQSLDGLNKIEIALMQSGKRLGQDFVASHQREIESSHARLHMTTPTMFTTSISGTIDNWKDICRDLEISVNAGRAGIDDYGRLIELYLYRGYPDRARQKLEKLKAINLGRQKVFEVVYLESKILMAEGRFKEAETLLVRYRNPVSLDITMALREIYLKTHRFGEAERIFSEERDCTNGDSDWIGMMGQAFYLRGEWQLAEDVYRTQLARIEDGNYRDGMQERLAVVLWNQGRIKEAQEKLKPLLSKSIDPDSIHELLERPPAVEARYDFATINLEEGKRKKNLSLLQQALAGYTELMKVLKEPFDEVIYGQALCLEEIGRLQRDTEKIKQANQIFATMAKRDVPYTRALFKMIEVYYTQENYLNMEAMVQRANDLLPEDFEAAYQRARIMRIKGDFANAGAEYKRAMKLAEAEGVLKEYKVPLTFGLAICELWQGNRFYPNHILQYDNPEFQPRNKAEWEQIVFAYKVLLTHPLTHMSKSDYQELYDKSWAVASKNGITAERIEALYNKWKKMYPKEAK